MRLNEAQKIDRPKSPRIQHVVSTIQDAVKPNFIPGSVPKTAKALGFTRTLFDVAGMEKLRFPIVFQGFIGIRST